MFSKKQNITLLIVCDDKKKYKVYAELLSGLISQNKKDNGDKTLENNISVTIQTEKVYLANESTMTSNTHVLFLGTFKEALTHQTNAHIKYKKYGMNYGWLGTRSVLFVDKETLEDINIEELWQLSGKYYKKTIEDFKQNDIFHDKEKEELEDEETESKHSRLKNKLGSKIEKIPGMKTNAAKIVGAGVLMTRASISSTLAMAGAAKLTYQSMLKITSAKKRNEEIKKEQYNCLVRAFYLEGLSLFLEA